jgi:hypothetical protein
MSPGGDHHAIHFRFTEFVLPMGMPRAPVDITNAMTIVCRARTTAAAWAAPIPDSFDVKINLVDIRTNWRAERIVNVHAEADHKKPGRRWIGA